MRIGNWVLFEKIPDIEELLDTAATLRSAVNRAHDMLEMNNKSTNELFNERVRQVEHVNARIEEKVDIELVSVNRLLEACQELDKRITEHKDTLERVQQLLRNHLLAHNTPL